MMPFSACCPVAPVPTCATRTFRPRVVSLTDMVISNDRRTLIRHTSRLYGGLCQTSEFTHSGCAPSLHHILRGVGSQEGSDHGTAALAGPASKRKAINGKMVVKRKVTFSITIHDTKIES